MLDRDLAREILSQILKALDTVIDIGWVFRILPAEGCKLFARNCIERFFSHF